jgi:hypothetical protein
MIYANLADVRAGKTPLLARAAIRLTSSQLKGSIKSDAGSALIEKFFAGNNFALKDREFFRQLFSEARENKFSVIFERAETAK